jgi:hypothetical protein
MKLARTFTQPATPMADTIAFESKSATIIAQRIPIKKITHFLTAAKSTENILLRTINTTINTFITGYQFSHQYYPGFL